MEPIIRVTDLRKHFRVRTKTPGLAASIRGLVRPTYRTVAAVDGISFTIEPGEVLGFNPHRQSKALAYEIGTVFGQKSQLWFHLLGSIYDMSRKELEQRVDFLTEVFEIGDLMDQPVRKLSLGQRIRCEMPRRCCTAPGSSSWTNRALAWT